MDHLSFCKLKLDIRVYKKSSHDVDILNNEHHLVVAPIACQI